MKNKINLKTTLILLILSVFVVKSIKSQEERYYYEDNIFHEIYKKNKVKSCIAIDKEYKNDTITNTTISCHYLFDREGNIVMEVDSYGGLESSCNDTLLYKYDNEHRHKKFIWLSKCPIQVDETKYYYDEKGRLIKYCDFSSKEGVTAVKLDSCISINYLNGKIISETTANNEVIFRFNHTGGKTYIRNKEDRLISVYKDENHIETHYEKEAYYRKYNEFHQLLLAERKDKEGKLIEYTEYEYENGLLVNSKKYNRKKEVISSTKFEYTFFE